MSDTTTSYGAHDSLGTRANLRRVDLLGQIAGAGGTISPFPDPFAVHGYTYKVTGDNLAGDLLFLVRHDYLEKRFFDRVSLCPKCDSHHLNVREICPGCRRAHLENQGLMHHFRCGYVGIPSEFAETADGGYTCPKCNSKMYHLGREYDRLGKAFACLACGLISENPPVEAVCFACSTRTGADNLISIDLFSYVLTSRGAAANRIGSLLDNDDELIFRTGAPVLRTAVTLQFIDHELQRLQQFKAGFSILLASCATTNPANDALIADWLVRLRGHLRNVDVLGQLADVLYVVIMPQTKRRVAEALCQRIRADFGPASPMTLSVIEIGEPTDLAKVLSLLKLPI